MKIVCISDTHNQHQALDGILPAGDILIHAGDIANHGTAAEIQEFVEWFSTQPHSYKLFIAGNHDRALEQDSHQITIPDNVIYLENQSICIAGLKIWGSPVSPPYRSMGFMWNDEQRQQLYQQIPEDCDIIINHSPAYGYVDQIHNGQHVGCQFLAKRISQIKPKLVICGHIHEAYAKLEKDGVCYINAAIMSSGYLPSNPPLSIEI